MTPMNTKSADGRLRLQARIGAIPVWVLSSLLAMVFGGCEPQSQDSAASAPKYSDPKVTFSTYLDAVMREDLDAAKACWTISDGNKSGALDLIVGMDVTTRRFSKMIHSNFKDLEEEMVRKDHLDEAIRLTMNRAKNSGFEVVGNTAKLTIKWQEDDGYPNEAFFFTLDEPIPFRKTGDGWKIDANNFCDLPADPSAVMKGEGLLGNAMSKHLRVMDAVVRDFQAEKIRTSEQVRKAMRQQQDAKSLPTVLRLEDFKTIYYKTNKERTKAYLFFSQPDYLVMVHGRGSKWDEEAEKDGLELIGVRDTVANRILYGTAPSNNATRMNDLWVVEMDIYVGTNGKPEDKYKMYLSTARSTWGIELPFKGTMDEPPEAKPEHDENGKDTLREGR